MDAGVNIFLDQALAQKNGVFEVVTIPRHEGHDHIASKGQFPLIRTRTVCNHCAFAHSLAYMHHWPLVYTRPVVRAHELQKVVHINTFFRIGFHPFAVFRCLAVFRHDDLPSGNRGNLTRSFTDNHRVRILGHFCFHPCPHYWSFGNEQRYPLALHVRAHQSSVRIVMFQERNQRSGHRNQLLRRHVHVMHLVRFDFEKLAAIAHGDSWRSKLAVTIHCRIRLRHDKVFLLVRR